jgi:GT2 family glycosyltransferase
MPSVSVIIATYNRPDDLRACIESLLKQSTLPQELIIVDDGALASVPLEAECTAAGIHCVYRRKDGNPGLTRSRNIGIDLAKGDIFLFLDDDAILSEDFIRHLVALYESDPEHKIGGVGGVITNHKPVTLGRRLRYWMDIPLLNSGLVEGHVLPSGFFTSYGTTGKPETTLRDVDFLSGSAMSYRREVCRELRFDEEHFSQYSYGEDKDYSYRVSLKWRLLLHPEMRYLHMEAKSMRPNVERMGYMYVVSRYLLFSRYLKQSIGNRLAFAYALAGYILVRSLITVLSPHKLGQELTRMRGIFRGTRAIMGGDLKVH